MIAPFASRLDLALKALSIGRGRLAQEIGVDKSLVSRWLSGAVKPSAFNVERITRLLAGHCPGFTMLDWEGTDAAFASRLNIACAPSPPLAFVTPVPATAHVAEAIAGFNGAAPLTPMLSIPYGLVEAAEKETARRAKTYTGRWRVTRLTASGKLAFVVDNMLIRPNGTGLWIEHFAGGHTLCGWLLVLSNRLYAMVADESDDSFAFYLLNGVVGPRAERIDGLFTSIGSHGYADAFSMVVVIDRVGELSGDDADLAWARDARDGTGFVDPEGIDPAVRAALARDAGAAAVAAGTGDAILRVPHDRSLSRGAERATG